MARIRRSKKVDEPIPKEVDFLEVRKMVRNEIEKRYGGVANFLNSEKGKEFGGSKIKIYLYDTGPINFKVISRLCSFLGIGEFTRDVNVTRTYVYKIAR